MSEFAPTLPQLQQWLQAVLVHPHCVRCGVESEEARRHLVVSPEQVDRVILPSRTLTALERVEVYSRMYPLRMREALTTDYPVLKQALGPGRWNELVDGYVRKHPSVHPNLNQLGKHLPAYLRSRSDWPQMAFLAELAELELAMTLVFDADESPALDPRVLSKLGPESWERAVFVPVKALQLRAFDYPVNAYLQAVKAGGAPGLPGPAPSFTAIYRKSYTVWRRGLSHDEHRMLELLLQGRTVGRALKKLDRESSRQLEELAGRIRDWFTLWVEDGLFSRIEPG